MVPSRRLHLGSIEATIKAKIVRVYRPIPDTFNATYINWLGNRTDARLYAGIWLHKMPTEDGQWIIEPYTRELILQRKLLGTACAFDLRLYQPPLYADAIRQLFIAGTSIDSKSEESLKFLFPHKGQ